MSIFYLIDLTVILNFQVMWKKTKLTSASCKKKKLKCLLLGLNFDFGKWFSFVRTHWNQEYEFYFTFILLDQGSAICGSVQLYFVGKGQEWFRFKKLQTPVQGFQLLWVQLFYSCFVVALQQALWYMCAICWLNRLIVSSLNEFRDKNFNDFIISDNKMMSLSN